MTLPKSDGADSLYDTDTNGGKGIIAQSEKNASKLFGSKRTLYSCSGSTLAIQTMLTLAKLRGNSKDHVISRQIFAPQLYKFLHPAGAYSILGISPKNTSAPPLLPKA